MLLVLTIEGLVALHDALLKLIKLIIKQLRLLTLGILGVSEDDASVLLESCEDGKKHVCLVVHLGLQLVTDLLLKASYSLISARDLSNVEICHDDEHKEC